MGGIVHRMPYGMYHHTTCNHSFDVCAVSRRNSASVAPNFPVLPLAGNIKSASEIFPRMINTLKSLSD